LIFRVRASGRLANVRTKLHALRSSQTGWIIMPGDLSPPPMSGS